MCGIVYIKRNDGKPANAAVLKGYRRQKSRGSDGFGFVAVNGQQGIAIARAETEKAILAKLAAERSPEILLHHRLPTSTPNVLDSTHPIAVSHTSLRYDYYLVHNGVITNDTLLKRDHEQRGFVYTTAMTKKLLTKHHVYTYPDAYFNDSEALAIDVALSLEGVQEGMRAEGSIAFIAVQVEKSTKQAVCLWYGRNDGSPLSMERSARGVAITSEGGSVSLRSDVLYRYSYETGQVTEHAQSIGTYSNRGQLGFAWESYDDDEDTFLYGLDLLREQRDELLRLLAIARQAGDRIEEQDVLEQLEAIQADIQYGEWFAA